MGHEVQHRREPTLIPRAGTTKYEKHRAPFFLTRSQVLGKTVFFIPIACRSEGTEVRPRSHEDTKGLS